MSAGGVFKSHQDLGHGGASGVRQYLREGFTPFSLLPSEQFYSVWTTSRWTELWSQSFKSPENLVCLLTSVSYCTPSPNLNSELELARWEISIHTPFNFLQGSRPTSLVWHSRPQPSSPAHVLGSITSCPHTLALTHTQLASPQLLQVLLNTFCVFSVRKALSNYFICQTLICSSRLSSETSSPGKFFTSSKKLLQKKKVLQCSKSLFRWPLL